MWVFDATPLIYLAKAEHLELIDHIDEPCAIPEPVYEEVVDTGIERGYPDARRIERAVENDVFDVVDAGETALAERLQDNENLSDADISVLAYADAHDAVAVMDETYGRDVAATEGIPTRGTAFLVLRLVKREVLRSDEARETIDAMLDAGWYCAPDVYAAILRKLDSLPK